MNPKPLWDKTVDNSRPLRKPKFMTNENVSIQNHSLGSNEVYTETNETSSGSSLSQNLNSVVPTFDMLHITEVASSKPSLNPDAPEWFPSSLVFNTETPKSVQNRLHVFKSQSDPQNLQDTDSEPFKFTCDSFVYENENDFEPDIKRLKQIITTLSKDPGQFDNLLDLFMETLMPYLDDILASSVIVQILVEYAISDSNFRYSGAKLCWYAEQHCPGFRAELHLQCKKQLGSVHNLQSVVLFIAELYIQLPHLNVFGTLLVDSFRKLLLADSMASDNENIKCLCQALKLTGYSLEQSNKMDLNEIMDQLEMRSKCKSGSISNLINSISNLRQNNWGHTNETVEAEDSEAIYYDGALNSPIIYQTEGNTLTTEESDFIAAHFQHASEEFLSDMSDPDDLCDPEPEMDEEIQAAFKEFLEYSSQK